MATAAIQLPEIMGDYPIQTEQVAAFHRDGHTLLRAVLSPAEVAFWRPRISAAVGRYKTEQRPLEERDTYGKAFLQIMNLWQRDEEVRRFVLARRFAKIAADLMGVDAVRLYHDQALYKESGGGPTPWHQDQYYWPLDTDKTVTMWMPLVEVTPEMGPMTFASGSHREGYLGKLEISDESDAHFARFVGQRGYDLVNYRYFAPGDATFHTGWTLHNASGNGTDRMREVMTIIFFADGARILQPDNRHREDDLRNWLPGAQPGGPAESPLSPLVYSTHDIA